MKKAWTIDVKHGQSDETRTGVTIDAADVLELEGSRGTVNLVIKFADAGEKAQCSIMSAEAYKAAFKKKKPALAYLPRAVTPEDSGEWVPIVAFEARGLEVTKLHLGVDDVVIQSTGGAVYDEDVDLSDGDWAEYDADASLSVSVTGATTKVMLVR